MLRVRALLALATLAAVTAANSPAAAVAQSPTPVAVPYVMPNSQRIDFVSAINGHRYSMLVALPLMPPPAKGYRVLYVLDGYNYFASAADATRANGNALDVVVVGIGYPEDEAFFTETLAKNPQSADLLARKPRRAAAFGLARQWDLTLPVTEDWVNSQKELGGSSLRSHDVGGVDDFLKIIETGVKPRVSALVRVDASNQALFGHSLGGLAVLRALFTEPTAFRSFIAASPSIWWAGKAVLADEPAFSAKVSSGAIAPRVLITVGDAEDDIPVLPPAQHDLQLKIAADIAQSPMIGTACDLADRLGGLHHAVAYRVEKCAVFQAQDHGISAWPAIGRAVSFAFPRE